MATKYEKTTTTKETETAEDDGQQAPPDSPEKADNDDEEGAEDAASVAAEGDDDEDDDEDDEPEERAQEPDAPAAPPAKKKEGAAPPPPQRMPGNAAAASKPRSIAAALGLPAGASMPAMLAAATHAKRVMDHAAAITGQTDGHAIIGGLNAIASDAADRKRAVESERKIRAKNAARERRDLLDGLVAQNIHTRGELWQDVEDPTTGKVSRRPNPESPIATAKLGTLRGYVAGKLKNASPRAPWEPSEDASKRATAAGNVQRVVETPIVKSIAARNPKLTPEQIAASYAALEQAGAFTH